MQRLLKALVVLSVGTLGLIGCSEEVTTYYVEDPALAPASANGSSTSPSNPSVPSQPAPGTTPANPSVPAGPAIQVSGWHPTWAGSAGDQTIANAGSAMDEINPTWYSLNADGSLKRSGEARKTVERPVVDLLLHYDWPGNVRELENELRRLVALSGRTIAERDLSPHIRSAAPSLPAARFAAVAAAPPADDDDRPLKERLASIERRILVQALKSHDNNKTRTAKALGLSRYGFLKKLDKYGLRD